MCSKPKGGGSSSGRTADSDSVNLGSSPSPPAKKAILTEDTVMAIVKRSTMTLFSNGLDIYSHMVRIVLAEKDLTTIDIVNVDLSAPSEELLEFNPYGTVPTLIDRDLVLYEANIIMEYLDERFPHPPLMPVYPIARAKSRLMMHRIDNDWLKLIPVILKNKKPESDDARKLLRDNLLTLIPVFDEMPYFLSEEYSLVDCYLSALLWRFPMLGINLPPQAKSIKKYMERMFKREAFQLSLSDQEHEIGE